MASISVASLTEYLMPILKRNFLEWQRLKNEMFARSKVKDKSRNDDKVKKIILSEPVAAFYAHWLKQPNNKEEDRALREKMVNFIKGTFPKNFNDENANILLFVKCTLVANIHRETTPNMIHSALMLQVLIDKENRTLQDIFENEKAFKIITKSSMSVIEWRLMTATSIGCMLHLEVSFKNIHKLTKASHAVLSKREKQLFS